MGKIWNWFISGGDYDEYKKREILRHAERITDKIANKLDEKDSVNLINRYLNDDDEDDILICDNCGRRHESKFSVSCRGKKWYKEDDICPECQKVCEGCRKIFCPEHIKSHNCKR